MDKMLHPQGRRTLIARPRPRSVLVIILAALSVYFLVFSAPSSSLRIVPYNKSGNTGTQTPLQDGRKPEQGDKSPSSSKSESVSLKPDPGHHHEEPTGTRAGWEINIEDLAYWTDPDFKETNDDVLPGYETDGKHREPGDIARLQHEKDLRKMWRYAYKTTSKYVSTGRPAGNLLHVCSKLVLIVRT
jgi:hypothetical protein